MLQRKTLAITLAALAAGISSSVYLAAVYSKRKHIQSKQNRMNNI